MEVDIIFDHDDFFAINKPCGIEHHGDQGVVQCIQSVYPGAKGVHRLDKETSGILLFAKNDQAASKLSKMFQNKTIHKTYVALAKGKPSKKQGTIKGDLVSTRNGSYKLTRSMDNPSITKFISEYDSELELRVFHLYPSTGKTHQLRVVMKSLGTPIIGDRRYGGMEADRMYLHACKLEFSYNSEPIALSCAPKFGALFESVAFL